MQQFKKFNVLNYMSESIASPLLDLALSYVTESNNGISSDALMTARKIFGVFIQDPSTYVSCKNEMIQLLGNVQALDKINAILSIEDDPIPEMVNFEENSQNPSRKKTRTWTTAEDNRLLKAIHKLGLENWNEVAHYVGNGRTRSQCSQRWIRVLDPRISKANWTKEEEAKLLDLVAQFGEKSWAKVSAKMGNRSDVQCRYRYQQIPKTLQSNVNKDSESEIISSPLKPKQSMIVRIETPQIKQEPVSSPEIDVNQIQPNHLVSFSIPPEVLVPPEIKLEDGIPLSASSFELFKSDNLFDSSFWIR